MSSDKYEASLRIFHPTQRAERIVDKVSLKCTLMQSVGDDRNTPKGAKLEGVYDRTYILYDLPRDNDERIEDLLRRVSNDIVAVNIQLFSDLVATGGKVEFFIGVFCEKHIGIELDSDVIEIIARAKMALSLDFYGDKF